MGHRSHECRYQFFRMTDTDSDTSAYFCVPGKIRVEEVGRIVRVMFHHLLDLDHTELVVVQNDYHYREIIFHRRYEICHSHGKSAIAGYTKHRSVRIRDFCCDCARVSQIPWSQGSLTSQTAAVSSGSSCQTTTGFHRHPARSLHRAGSSLTAPS